MATYVIETLKNSRKYIGRTHANASHKSSYLHFLLGKITDLAAAWPLAWLVLNDTKETTNIRLCGVWTCSHPVPPELPGREQGSHPFSQGRPAATACRQPPWVDLASWQRRSCSGPHGEEDSVPSLTRERAVDGHRLRVPCHTGRSAASNSVEVQHLCSQASHVSSGENGQIWPFSEISAQNEPDMRKKTHKLTLLLGWHAWWRDSCA